MYMNIRKDKYIQKHPTYVKVSVIACDNLKSRYTEKCKSSVEKYGFDIYLLIPWEKRARQITYTHTNNKMKL